MLFRSEDGVDTTPTASPTGLQQNQNPRLPQETPLNVTTDSDCRITNSPLKVASEGLCSHKTQTLRNNQILDKTPISPERRGHTTSNKPTSNLRPPIQKEIFNRAGPRFAALLWHLQQATSGYHWHLKRDIDLETRNIRREAKEKKPTYRKGTRKPAEIAAQTPEQLPAPPRQQTQLLAYGARRRRRSNHGG